MNAEERKRKKEDERRELAAMMLVDAVFESDEVVSKRYGKGADARQLRTYRASLPTDPLLVALVERRLAERRAAWASRIPDVLTRLMAAAEAVTQKVLANPIYNSSPGTLKDITESAEVFAKIELTFKAIDARSAKRDRQDGGQTLREEAEDDGSQSLVC